MRDQVRLAASRVAEPSAAAVDPQSVKAAETTNDYNETTRPWSSCLRSELRTASGWSRGRSGYRVCLYVVSNAYAHRVATSLAGQDLPYSSGVAADTVALPPSDPTPE
jgi:hypothetical protein